MHNKAWITFLFFHWITENMLSKWEENGDQNASDFSNAGRVENNKYIHKQFDTFTASVNVTVGFGTGLGLTGDRFLGT